MYTAPRKHLSKDIFNSAIAAYAISAANELGVLEELKKYNFVDINDFANNNNLDISSLTAIVNVLCSFEICRPAEIDNCFYQDSVFEDIYNNQGFFLWLTRGYGELMQNLASITVKSNRIDNYIPQEGKYIALASRQQGKLMVDTYFETALFEVSFNCVVDLGCGSGERLIKLAKQCPQLKGIGIDISSKAVELAKSLVSEANCQDRITIFRDDMRNLQPKKEFFDVDTIFSFFSGHDMWPRENCVSILRNFRDIFPNANRFLLCDTYSSGLIPSLEIPIFTLGFETIHAVMGQHIPSLEEWMNLFPESKWRCVNQYYVEVPFCTIFDLRAE